MLADQGDRPDLSPLELFKPIYSKCVIQYKETRAQKKPDRELETEVKYNTPSLSKST